MMKKMTMLFLVTVIVGVSSAYAGDIITVTGSQNRVELTEKFFATKGVVITKQVSDEVMGTFKSEPWPGVNVSSGVPGEDGIFVPISDKALAKGLCTDQKKLLLSFVPVTPPEKTAVAVVPVPPQVKKAPPVTVMQICVDGTGCDEHAFVGNIPSATLEATDGAVIDILEVHQRSKTPQFKVKRLRVLTDGVAYPLQWVSSGACVRAYQSEIFSQAQMSTLVLSGEVLEQLKSGDEFFTDGGGAHNTIAVYLIHQNVVDYEKESATAINELHTEAPRVFTMDLPVAQPLLTNVK